MPNMNHRLACFFKTRKIFMACFVCCLESPIFLNMTNRTGHCILELHRPKTASLPLCFAHSQRLEKFIFCSNVPRAYTDYDVKLSLSVAS